MQWHCSKGPTGKRIRIVSGDEARGTPSRSDPWPLFGCAVLLVAGGVSVALILAALAALAWAIGWRL
jgi:hypothetical protein